MDDSVGPYPLLFGEWGPLTPNSTPVDPEIFLEERVLTYLFRSKNVVPSINLPSFIKI